MHAPGGGGTGRSHMRDVGAALAPPASAEGRIRQVEHQAELSAVRRAVGDRFEILRPLGCGGNGSVFESWDRQAGCRVAIKALRARFHSSPAIRARFWREAEITARLRHPNLVVLRELGESYGVPFMVLDLIPGECLAQRLAEARALAAWEAARIMRDLASALAHVHASGIVHRDVKPENVLLESESGRAVLTDFGIAALATDDPWGSGAGRAPGTPQYMAPEQSEARGVDARSDIYALGVVGYRMLAGLLPFDGRDAELIAASHRDLAPPPLAELVPESATPLVRIVERCLAKKASSRFRTAAALQRALDDAQLRPSVPMTRRPAGSYVELTPPRRR